MSAIEPGRPVRRPTLVEKLEFELAVRDIESVLDPYVALLATTRPGPGTNGWRRRLRQRVDGLRGLEDASAMLSELLEALDLHETGQTQLEEENNDGSR